MKYIQHYPQAVQQQVQQLIDQNQLAAYLLNKYPTTHTFRSERALYDYCQQLKNQYLKTSPPISKVIYDPKIHVIKNALGLHTFHNRMQGNKIKSKNEIKIATLFKRVPLPFLTMILVHELAHIREKEHNKAFYQLCQYMQPNYHQLELDVRIYLTQLHLQGNIYN